jgi:hypothetical protein
MQGCASPDLVWRGPLRQGALASPSRCFSTTSKRNTSSPLSIFLTLLPSHSHSSSSTLCSTLLPWPARRPICLASVSVSAVTPYLLLPLALPAYRNPSIAPAINPRRATMARPTSFKLRQRRVSDAPSRDGVDVSNPHSPTTFKPFEFELPLIF